MPRDAVAICVCLCLCIDHTELIYTEKAWNCLYGKLFTSVSLRPLDKCSDLLHVESFPVYFYKAVFLISEAAVSFISSLRNMVHSLSEELLYCEGLSADWTMTLLMSFICKVFEMAHNNDLLLLALLCFISFCFHIFPLCSSYFLFFSFSFSLLPFCFLSALKSTLALSSLFLFVMLLFVMLCVWNRNEMNSKTWILKMDILEVWAEIVMFKNYFWLSKL